MKGSWVAPPRVLVVSLIRFPPSRIGECACSLQFIPYDLLSEKDREKKNIPEHFHMLRYVLNFATIPDHISVRILLQRPERNFKAADKLEPWREQGCSALLIPFQLERRRFLIKYTRYDIFCWIRSPFLRYLSVPWSLLSVFWHNNWGNMWNLLFSLNSTDPLIDYHHSDTVVPSLAALL